MIKISKDSAPASMKGFKKIFIDLDWADKDGYDLDSTLFGLNSTGKLHGEDDDYMSFYGREGLTSPCGGLTHSGDARSGKKSDMTGNQYDERITIDFTKLNQAIVEMIGVVTIHKAAERGQNFSQVPTVARVIDFSDGTEKVLFKINLDEDNATDTAIDGFRFFKDGDEWKFEVTATGYQENFEYFIRRYFSGELN